MTDKERFISLCGGINRTGMDKLLEWLESSDFYTAPASTRFHGNYEGGLLQHSLNVYDNLVKVVDMMKIDTYSQETLLITALFHDICKANFYKKGTRNVKDEFGKWTTKEVYEISDDFPLGHGEKSCIILEAFIRLTKPELLAIRWHMAGYDSATKGGDYGCSNAQDQTKLVTLLQVADMLSTMNETKV